MSLPQVPSLKPVEVTYQPYFIAMVIDGVVYDVMNVDEQNASKYMSQPTFVQVAMGEASLGYTYDGTTFTPPA